MDFEEVEVNMNCELISARDRHYLRKSQYFRKKRTKSFSRTMDEKWAHRAYCGMKEQLRREKERERYMHIVAV